MDADVEKEEEAKEAPGATADRFEMDGEEAPEEDGAKKSEEVLGEAAPAPAAPKAKSRGFGGKGKQVARVRQSTGEVDVSGGGLDADAIEKVVGQHGDEMSDCYAQGLLVDPKLEGEITLALEIDGDGTVSSAKIPDADDFGASDVTDCIAKAAGAWHFPAPGAGETVKVSYPLKLSPGE